MEDLIALLSHTQLNNQAGICEIIMEVRLTLLTKHDFCNSALSLMSEVLSSVESHKERIHYYHYSANIKLVVMTTYKIFTA